MGKIRKSIQKRFKLSKPRGNKDPKVKYIKPGGKHLLTPKGPRVQRRLKDRNKIMKPSRIKEYMELILSTKQ